MDQKETQGTAKILLLRTLEELSSNEFKKLKFLLAEFPVKDGKSNIPQGLLEAADCIKIAELMVAHYEDRLALEILSDLLQGIPRLDLLDQLHIATKPYLVEKRKLNVAEVEENKIKYKEYIKKRFRSIKEKNSRIGEYVKLKERYTRLLIIKNHRQEEEKKHEIIFTGRRHLELMAQRAEQSYSSIEALFDPDEDGDIPSTIVLQGVAGIGKTMTARKIMLDWASGELLQDRFDFLFYIHCRDLNQLSGHQTTEELIVHSCGGEQILSMREIEAEPKKLLFIIDGFDELKIPKDLQLEDPYIKCPLGNTMINLIRKKYLSQSCVLITTRPSAVETLMKCVTDERFAEILGFSESERKEYFIRFFGNEAQGSHAFNIVKDYDMLFTMCFVPIVCWIVCTALKQQMEMNENVVYVLRTTTSVYMLFLSNLLKQQSRDAVQPIICRNLKRLCSLAKEGIYEHKILFDQADIVRHSVDVPAIQSLFLQNDIFQKTYENYSLYSFVHLSFQEFFTALFYILGENEATPEQRADPEREIIHLLEDYRENDYLMLTVRFLFGLLNKDCMDHMERAFQWKISSDIKPALQRWIKKEIKLICCKNKEKSKGGGGEISDYQMDLLNCLYEVQDEEFVKSAIEDLKDVVLKLNRRLNAMDCRALAFCLKNCPGVRGIDLSGIDLDVEGLRELKPGLMKSSRLRMVRCCLTTPCCADLSFLLKTNTSLTELDLSDNKLGNSGVRELCEGLKHPSCTIQKLRLDFCCLTGLCCADLASVLKTNTSLREFHLSGNALGDFGVRDLCEGLKDPRCTVQILNLDTLSILMDLLKSMNIQIMHYGLLFLTHRRLLVAHPPLDDLPCYFAVVARMSGCSLVGLCCADFASVFKTSTSLTKLELSINKLGDHGVRDLCEGLKHPDCKLQTLCVFQCTLTGSSCADLASVLKINTSLTVLHLSDNELEDSGVRDLCEGLKHHSCKIQTLWMKRCSLTGLCCANLSAVLRINKSLTELDLRGNKLENSGLRDLCEGLKHPDCRIQTLNVSDCALSDDCTEALCSAFRTKDSLKYLDLTWNDFTRSSESSFSELKETCTGLDLRINYDFKVKKPVEELKKSCILC